MAARKKILESFNDNPLPQVLMMTLKTGGVGLNLTKANYVFHVEPWWNPAAESQGNDRVHRLGQTKNVHVFRYIMNDSVEEKMETLKSRKNEAFAALLEENGKIDQKTFNANKGISHEDFKYLLN